MITHTDALALIGIAVAICSGILCLHRIGRVQDFVRLKGRAKGWLLVLFLALLVPIPGTGIALAGFVRGFIGDLSITLLAMCVWSLCHRLLGVAAIGKRELSVLLVVVGVAALLLYPTALGWGDWDAYRMGWGSWWFFSALLVLSGASARMGLRVLPALVALSLLGWSVGLMESGNLWDYLLDPWLSAFALGFVFIKCSQVVFTRFINRSSH
jgi:hypothetical protein